MTDVTKNAPSLLPEQLAILDRARQELPAPFAPLAAELLFELSTSSPDWGRVFLLQIDLFEASVAFLSFLLLAQLATPNQRILESASSIAKLREDGTKLSTGHWWGLLRAASCDVARAGSPPLEPARLASALYFGDASRASGGDGSGIAKLLDAVPNLRNRVKGHAWTLPPEQYEQHARTLLDTTARFVGALDGFRRCSLFVVAHCSAAGDGFDLDLRVLRRYRRFLGLEGDFGPPIGLSPAFITDVISQVGNYGESFERNLGTKTPIGLPRGVNNLWNKGGLMYAPPVR